MHRLIHKKAFDHTCTRRLSGFLCSMYCRSSNWNKCNLIGAHCTAGLVTAPEDKIRLAFCPFRQSPTEFESGAEGPLVETIATGIADAQRFHETAAINVVGRIRVMRRVCDVERFDTELQLGLFTESPLAVQTHIKIDDSWSSQGVGATGAEASRGRHSEL